MTTYNWTRDVICSHCGNSFLRTGGSATECDTCRELPEVIAKHEARRKRKRNLLERRKRAVARWERRGILGGHPTPADAPSTPGIAAIGIRSDGGRAA